MVEGGKLKTSNTAKTKVITVEAKVNTVETKVNTVEAKVKLIPNLLILFLLLLISFRATKATSYLRFSDQTNEPIDQARVCFHFHLNFFAKTFDQYHNLQATNFASLDGTIVAKNLTQFTICASIYVGFFRKCILD